MREEVAHQCNVSLRFAFDVLWPDISDIESPMSSILELYEPSQRWNPMDKVSSEDLVERLLNS
ncbi:hypothetical protein JNK13_00690 [bacterium]|nr:hypothetical protein [bacterium]